MSVEQSASMQSVDQFLCAVETVTLASQANPAEFVATVSRFLDTRSRVARLAFRSIEKRHS